MTLENVEWSDCLIEPRHDERLEAYVKREFGVVPPAVPYLAGSAWIVPGMVALLPPHLRLVHISSDLAELVGLVVSQDNSCRYCYGTQRALLRMQGVPEKRIQQIEHNFLEAEISPSERLALEFARHISRASPLAGESDRQRLHEVGYDDAAINEIAFLAAAHV